MSLESLNLVFRALMTAIHQQSIHQHVLRSWEAAPLGEVIARAAKTDFSLAMQLAHRIVCLGGVPELRLRTGPYSRHMPVVGSSVADVIATELALEGRLSAIVSHALADLAAGDDDESSGLLEMALRARVHHRTWLQSLTTPVQGPAPSHTLGALDVFFAQLIAFAEQTFVHAFGLWREGAPAWADGAWASSGAATMQAARVVTLLSGHGAVPRPAVVADGAISAPSPALDPADMLFRDRFLAYRCRDLAALAAESTRDPGLSSLLHEIAVYYGTLCDWGREQPHPANDRPAAFRRFGETLARYVPRASPSGLAAAV
ncbi:MAG: ferritin-like domain-containing protein [Dongiaceae bacterium]